MSCSLFYIIFIIFNFHIFLKRNVGVAETFMLTDRIKIFLMFLFEANIIFAKLYRKLFRKKDKSAE